MNTHLQKYYKSKNMICQDNKKKVTVANARK